MTSNPRDSTWAPEACALPTAQRPLRIAEFDALFASSVRAVEQSVPTKARFALAETEGLRARVEDLTARETACCSFFTFTISEDGPDVLLLDVEVPPAQLEVLTTLVARARAA